MTQFPRLLEIEDRRPVDWNSGKRMPADPDDMVECNRCSRMHAVIARIATSPDAVLSVGTGCMRKVLAGWVPTKDELRAARKLREKREAEEAEALIEKWVRILRPRVAQIAVPSADRIDAPAYAVRVRIGSMPWGQAFVSGLTPERVALRHATETAILQYIAHEVNRMLDAPDVPNFLKLSVHRRLDGAMAQAVGAALGRVVVVDARTGVAS